jgi:uncharacterized protein YceH (UPF0502 family)
VPRGAAPAGEYHRRVHFTELTAPEQRVLGCLIEKRWTTPDQYPLSLNALRLACNQSTNRDPVTRYDEDTVFRAAQRLCQYGLARLASGHSSRATKYRHLAEEGLSLNREQLAVLAVLLLRGPQTPGELKARSERMAAAQSLAGIERVLGELGERGYARRLGRRPGQKEDRFVHLLGGEPAAEALDGAAGPEPSWRADAGRAPAAPAPGVDGGRAGGAPAAGVDAARAGVAPAPAAPAPAAPAPAAPAPAAPAPAAPAPAAPAPGAPASAPDRASAPGGPRAPAVDAALESRVAALEQEVVSLRAQLEELLS